MKKNFVVIVGLFLSFSLFAEARNALLIANEKYKTKNFNPLKTPVRDAKDLKKVLEELNFNVTLVQNADLNEMDEVLKEFSKKLEEEGGIGLFHYGGHAIQINGKNYLIPVNGSFETEKQFERNALLADDVTEVMSAETNIVIFDSCRTELKESELFRSNSNTSRGLALIQNVSNGTLVAYSVQSGSNAKDGLYTPILTKKLKENKEIHKIFQEVRNEVYEESAHEQCPTETYSLFGEVFLAGKPQDPSTITQDVDHNTYSDKVDFFSENDNNKKIRPYSFGLYVTGNLVTFPSFKYDTYHWLNGFTIYLMWAEFNKKGNDGIKVMLGSSYSYSGNGISRENYGFSYQNFEIGSVYIGLGDSSAHMYIGIGLGLVRTGFKFSVGNSNIQQSFSYDFFIDLHWGVLEINLTDKIVIRIDGLDYKFRPNAFSIDEINYTKLGLGISL